MSEKRPNIFGKAMAIDGDKTTTGATCIASSSMIKYKGTPAVIVGDLTTTCPQCKQTGTIATGDSRMMNNRKPQAVDGSIVQCGCPYGSNTIIAASYKNAGTFKFSPFSPQETSSGYSQYNDPQYNRSFREYAAPVSDEQDNRIRLDAQRLIDCAAEICEKHLCYPEVKAEFKQEIQSAADDIVQQVESGQMSYEQGAAELKKEEKSLIDQSLDWLINGLSILGGLGITIAGFALCTTGGGCLIGAPLMAHGLNGMYEGTMGFYEGHSNVQGPLREGYKATAKLLGFNESVGNLAYDLVDMGISIRGKLQLVPKLTKRYGEKRKIKPFVLFHYGRKDLDYAFKQANKYLFTAEIASDIINFIKIKDDIKNAFILDKATGTIMLTVAEPEKITNIEYLKEHCSMVITIIGSDNDPSSYYMCKDKNGNRYDVSNDGKLISE